MLYSKLILATSVVAIGFSSKPLLNTVVENNIMDMDAGVSYAHPTQGWIKLFNGKDMTGWRTYQNRSSDSWEVVNGMLHCKGPKASKHADLVTNDEYENFELSIDWKMAPKGNSGILYLVKEDQKESYLTGPEYQLIDDEGYPEKLEEWQKTGANYAMNSAPDAKPKAIGKWNNTKIKVNKGHVEHWLNGKKIVDYQIGSAEWNKNKAEGKWKDAAEYGVAKKGHIALQNHGSEVWFKNIKVKQL
jgi:hypothetical protein